MAGFDRTSIGATGYVGTSAAAVCTTPSGKKMYVACIKLFNSHTDALTVSIYNVPNGGSASGSNQIGEVTLQPKETFFFEDSAHPMVLATAGDTIQASTTTASKVTATPIGDYYTP